MAAPRLARSAISSRYTAASAPNIASALACPEVEVKGPNQNCMVDGDGSVTLISADATEPTKSTSSPDTDVVRAMEPVTCGAVNARRSPSSSVNEKRAAPTSTPSTTSTNRFQYDSLRNSPSVTTPSPADSCSATTSRIAASCAAD